MGKHAHSRPWKTALAGVLLAGSVLVLAGSAAAANSPTFRDCSFAGGLDPDFVRLSGATLGQNGTLTVPVTQQSVQVVASESSDPGDSSGHDTLTITISSEGIASKTVSGDGVGKVTLTAPLDQTAPGRSYTISWSATFDNNNHRCPSSFTPHNTTPRPFVLTVSAGGGTPHGHKKHHCHAHSKHSKACKHSHKPHH